MEGKEDKTKIQVGNIVVPSPAPFEANIYSAKDIIPFGKGNMFPSELAAFMRSAKIQRGISNDKTDHFAGTYFVSGNKQFLSWEKSSGIGGESFYKVHKKIVKDKQYSGNAYLILITDSKGSALKVQHIDYTKVRVDKNHNLVINPDWKRRKKELDQTVTLYPTFTKGNDGLYYSAIHFKEYEAEFNWYGIPDWITGWANMQIDIKSDAWNLSHIDKGLKFDIVVTAPAGLSEPEIALIKQSVKEYKTSEDGESVLYLFGDGAKANVMNAKVLDMDWEKMNDQNIDKTLLANSWYKSLMSISQSTGFDTERVKYEYQLALRKIQSEQEMFLEVYRKVLNQFGIFADDLMIYNTPILPRESVEDRLVKMMPFFSDSQKAEIGNKYFNLLINEDSE